MPIPSYVKQLHDRAVLEGLEQGLEQGREQGMEQGLEQGVEQAAAALLRHRFGPDGRIPVIAKRLARLGPDAWVARIDEADSLDELTD